MGTEAKFKFHSFKDSIYQNLHLVLHLGEMSIWNTRKNETAFKLFRVEIIRFVECSSYFTCIGKWLKGRRRVFTEQPLSPGTSPHLNGSPFTSVVG